MALKDAARRTADPVAEGPLAVTRQPEPQRLDQQLCFALYSAVNRVTRLYRPLLAELGLTYPQYLTLLALWETSPRTVGGLGEALDLDSGTLTPLLKRLEKQKLIRRRRDPADERRVIIELTDTGQALRVRAADVPAALACKIAVPPAELIELRTRIHHLNRQIDAERDDGAGRAP